MNRADPEDIREAVRGRNARRGTALERSAEVIREAQRGHGGSGRRIGGGGAHLRVCASRGTVAGLQPPFPTPSPSVPMRTGGGQDGRHPPILWDTPGAVWAGPSLWQYPPPIQADIRRERGGGSGVGVLSIGGGRGSMQPPGWPMSPQKGLN